MLSAPLSTLSLQQLQTLTRNAAVVGKRTTAVYV